MFIPKMPQSRIIQEYRDQIEETKKEQQLHSSCDNDGVNNTNITNSIIGNSKGTVLGNSSINTKTVEDDIIVDEDNNHNGNDNNNPLKQITNITNSNTSSNIGSNSSIEYDDILDNEKSEYSDFLADLTLEELEEAEEYCNDLFQHKIGSHLTYGTLHKLFLMVEPSYSALTEEEAEKFITKLFDNFKKEYTSEEKQYLQKRYPFRYKPYDNEEGAFYELHEVYKANPLILEEKYVLTRFTKKDSFEKKLVLSRIPYEVLQYTKEHFSNENPLYIPYIEREMNKINQCKYSNLFK